MSPKMSKLISHLKIIVLLKRMSIERPKVVITVITTLGPSIDSLLSSTPGGSQLALSALCEVPRDGSGSPCLGFYKLEHDLQLSAFLPLPPGQARMHRAEGAIGEKKTLSACRRGRKGPGTLLT